MNSKIVIIDLTPIVDTLGNLAIGVQYFQDFSTPRLGVEIA